MDNDKQTISLAEQHATEIERAFILESPLRKISFCIFSFRNRVLATLRSDEIDYDRNYWPHSEIFICPQCGEEWARIILQRPEYPPDQLPRFSITSKYCERHMERMWPEAMPGCFAPVHYVDWYRFMPRPILIHDFLMQQQLRETLRGSRIAQTA